MTYRLLKEYLLLEVSALSLKDVLSYIKGEEDSSVVNRLKSLWNKRYRKYSNVMISLLTNSSQSESTVDLLEKILNALDRYDPYFNTSYLTKEMKKEYKDISVTLEEINNFVQSMKNKSEVLSEDRVSLQAILDVWRKAGSPKTFESNHFDIIHADKDITIVKPKTPKGSVAWASCTGNGVLERYGSEDIGNEYKSSWCTSIYKADKKSFNEFYTYYLGEMVSLYYVIKNKDYDLNDDYRRICIGIDDINNKIEYDGAVTVNAKNSLLEKQEDIKLGYSEDVFYKILGKIYLDPKNAEEKQEDYPSTKNEVNILFKNRYKSFTAMSKLRLFLCKTKDENLISFIIDLLVDAYKKDAIENDLEFILDFLNNIFNESKLGKKVIFSNQILSSLNKIIKMESYITSEILVKINTIVSSEKIDSFNVSLLSLLKNAMDVLNSKRQHDLMKSILEKLELDSTLIKLVDLRPVADLFKKANKDFDYLIDSAKVEDESVYKYIIENNLYQKNIQELNHSLLTNPLLFKTTIGKKLLESLLNKDKKVYPYFVKLISAIAENDSLPEYDNIYKLITGLVTNEMFTDDFLEIYSLEVRSLISEQELNQYLTLAYNIYKDKEDVFSVEIIDKIEGMFEEEEYKKLSP